MSAHGILADVLPGSVGAMSGVALSTLAYCPDSGSGSSPPTLAPLCLSPLPQHVTLWQPRTGEFQNTQYRELGPPPQE